METRLLAWVAKEITETDLLDRKCQFPCPGRTL
jgi:hypothetical protein